MLPLTMRFAYFAGILPAYFDAVSHVLLFAERQYFDSRRKYDYRCCDFFHGAYTCYQHSRLHTAFTPPWRPSLPADTPYFLFLSFHCQDKLRQPSPRLCSTTLGLAPTPEDWVRAFHIHKRARQNFCLRQKKLAVSHIIRKNTKVEITAISWFTLHLLSHIDISRLISIFDYYYLPLMRSCHGS